VPIAPSSTVAAGHAPPSTLERFRGNDLVQVAGRTQALRRTVQAEPHITGSERTTVSVPDAFGALILKAAVPGRTPATATAT